MSSPLYKYSEPFARIVASYFDLENFNSGNNKHVSTHVCVYIYLGLTLYLDLAQVRYIGLTHFCCSRRRVRVNPPRVCIHLSFHIYLIYIHIYIYIYKPFVRIVAGSFDLESFELGEPTYLRNTSLSTYTCVYLIYIRIFCTSLEARMYPLTYISCHINIYALREPFARVVASDFDFESLQLGELVAQNIHIMYIYIYIYIYI